jgi:hypothetical protein
MKPTTLIGCALVVLGLTVGCQCRECLHPYDNCGPVYEVGPRNCDPDYRSGSILNACQSRGTVNPPSTVKTAPVE